MLKPFRNAFLTILCLLLFVPASVHGATASSQSTELQELIKQFDALVKDEKRNNRRDMWLAMEDAFSALENKSKGDNAARAAFYNARSRQELARRSFHAADHKEAVARFGSIADKYGKYSAAPAALYRQGYILHKSLDNHKAAVVSLERLIKSYPKAKDAAQAQKLLAEAKNAATETKPQAENSPKKEPSVSLKSIRWKGKGQRAVITLELDAEAGYEYEFVAPDATKKTPGRLHLDIEGASPSEQIKPGLKPQNLVVSRIRTSNSADGVRITLDCDDVRCYAVTSPSQKPQIIQIEVSRKEDIKGGTLVSQPKSSKQKEKTSGDAASAPAKGKSSAPKSSDAVMKQLGLTVETIMIDAGHGGKDPGAMASSFVEKKFTLAMARRVGALLQKEGFKVIYTRSGDKFISLQDRPDMANNKKADLFISIHINANPNSKVRGLETYYLDSAKTQDAATVAARENAVSVKNISDLQVILTDLMLSSKLEESRHLASCVHKGILRRLRSANMAAVDNGSRSAPFYVLMGARMPAILVEFGYITNAEDAASLGREAYLQRQAEGLVQGIKQYKQELARIAQK